MIPIVKTSKFINKVEKKPETKVVVASVSIEEKILPPLPLPKI
jgi:hypothetical protein